MPARNIDQVLIQNWAETGQQVPVDQWTADITIKWTDLDGVQHEHSGTYAFPNALAPMPLATRRYFIEQMIMARVRVELGIDVWEDYR